MTDPEPGADLEPTAPRPVEPLPAAPSRAWFDDARFTDSAVFSDVQFLDTATFRDTDFQGRALFGGSVFHRRTSFTYALFGRWANFTGVRFVEGVDVYPARARLDVRHEDANRAWPKDGELLEPTPPDDGKIPHHDGVWAPSWCRAVQAGRPGGISPFEARRKPARCRV